MICCNIAQNQLASCEKPDITGVVEVRPKLRNVLAPGQVLASAPVIIALSEVKPDTEDATAESTVTAPEAPSNISAQEIKPKIIKVEEE
jgi:hypothetical protein